MRIVSTERAETRTFRIHVEDVPLRSMRWDVGGDYQPTEVRIIWTKSVDGVWEDGPHVTLIGVRGAVSSYLEPIVMGEDEMPEWVTQLVEDTRPECAVDISEWHEDEIDLIEGWTKASVKTLSNGEFLVVWEDSCDSVWSWERWTSEDDFIGGDEYDYDRTTSNCLGYGSADNLKDAQTDAENDCRDLDYGWQLVGDSFPDAYGGEVYKKMTDEGEFLIVFHDDDALYPWTWEYWVSESGWAEAMTLGQGFSSLAYISDGSSTTLGLAQSEAEQYEQDWNCDRDTENDSKSVVESYAARCANAPERFSR